MNSRQNAHRRQFLKIIAQGSFAAAAVTLLNPFRTVQALAAEAKGSKGKAAKPEPLPAGKAEVTSADPVASAVGYVSDATKADKSKRKDPKSKCSNCALYSSVNGSWGNCQMITNGLVSSGGWCASYNKKS